MSKRFDLIVFDWDGTLMDSAAAIVAAIQSACRDLGVAEPTEDRARHVIGLGLVDALRIAVPDLVAEQYGDMVAAYRRHYLAGDQALTLFRGTLPMLESLNASGVALGVATGKSRVGLERALDTTTTRQYFRSTRCADECFSKPHPQMLHEIMEEVGAVPERTVMIGDTTHDLQMAAAAGTAAVAVTFGAHPKEQLLAHPLAAAFDSTWELSAWLHANA